MESDRSSVGVPIDTYCVGQDNLKGEKTARRVLRLLKFISEQDGEVSTRTVAHQMGVSLPTAYHLLNALIQEGYVERIPGRNGYRLGSMIPLLYQRSLAGSDIVSDIDPVLEELAERSRQRSYLAVYRDGKVVVVAVKPMPGSPKLPQVVLGVGDGGHALAIGKILLANMSEEDLEDYSEESETLQPFTDRTITDPSKLDRCLNQVRNQGFATDLEEFAEGFCCVAAPIRGPSGDVEASIGLSAPSRRFYAEGKSFVHLVLEAGKEASVIRGYREGDTIRRRRAEHEGSPAARVR